MGFWGGLGSWLSGSSPGTAVGQAGAEVIKGVFQSVNDLIEEFHLPPDKAAEVKLRLKQQEIDSMQIQLLDVQSARQMQMNTHSVWPGILTFIITVGFFSIIIMIIIHGMPALTSSGTEALLMLLGTLTTAFAGVCGFWFGKNSGSDETKRMLFNAVPRPEGISTKTTSVSESTTATNGSEQK